jgi:ectoine hydroxylase-related dioxygenase (phytanoyl-CoA dioxygenase family)
MSSLTSQNVHDTCFHDSTIMRQCIGFLVKTLIRGGATLSSDATTEPNIANEQVLRFESDGAVCLRQVIPMDWIEQLREGTQQALAVPGPYHHIQSSKDDPGHFFTEYYLTRRLEIFARFVRESPLPGLAAQLLKSTNVRFFFDGLFVKEAATQKRSQWHQDQPYYPIDGKQIVVFWTPLDPVNKQTCLEVVRASHDWGKWFVPVLFRNNHGFENNDPRYEAVPDMQTTSANYDYLSWDMQPGDCIAFHGLSLHGAAGNPGLKSRRALSTTWLGDDAVFAPRASELEPHFANLDYAAGEPLHDESEFPLVWTRADRQLEQGGHE